MPEIDLDADLELELTTSTGDVVVARIGGTGSHLTVAVDRPQLLLAMVERAQVTQVAELLADLGLRVDVVGPRGPLAVLGAGIRSRFGRLVTGSMRVEPTWLAATWLAVQSRSARRGAATTLVVVTALSAIRRRLRR